MSEARRGDGWLPAAGVAAAVVLGVLLTRVSGLGVLGLGVGLLLVGALLSRSPRLLIGLLIGFMPLAGQATIVRLESLPGLTVERAGVLCALMAIARIRRTRMAEVPTADAERRWRLLIGVTGAGVVLVAQSAFRSADPAMGVRVVVDSYAMPLLLLIGLTSIPWSPEEVKESVWGLMAGAMAWVGLAFMEVLTRRSLYTATGELYGSYGTYVRAAGPFINTAALGWVLGVVGVVAVAMALGDRRKRTVMFALLTLIILGLGATLTRGAWIGFLAGAGVVLLLLSHRSKFATVSMVGASAIAALVAESLMSKSVVLERLGDSGTVYARFGTYATSLALASRNPIFGLGIGAYDRLSQGNLVGMGGASAASAAGLAAPHNSLLLVAVESGWPAAVLLVVAIVLLVQRLRVALGTRQRSWVDAAGLGIVVATVLNASTFDIQMQAHANITVAMILGMTLGCLRFGQDGDECAS